MFIFDDLPSNLDGSAGERSGERSSVRSGDGNGDAPAEPIGRCASPVAPSTASPVAPSPVGARPGGVPSAIGESTLATTRRADTAPPFLRLLAVPPLTGPTFLRLGGFVTSMSSRSDDWLVLWVDGSVPSCSSDGPFASSAAEDAMLRAGSASANWLGGTLTPAVERWDSR